MDFENLPLPFRKALACPLHDECPLSVLVSQFRGNWILIQIGCWRGHPDLSFGAEWSVVIADSRLIQFVIHLFPGSFISHLIIPMFPYDGALV